jgi:hypothetical protein
VIGGKEDERIAVVPLPGAARRRNVFGRLDRLAALTLCGMRVGRAKDRKSRLGLVADIPRTRGGSMDAGEIAPQMPVFIPLQALDDLGFDVGRFVLQCPILCQAGNAGAVSRTNTVSHPGINHQILSVICSKTVQSERSSDMHFVDLAKCRRSHRVS